MAHARSMAVPIGVLVGAIGLCGVLASGCEGAQDAPKLSKGGAAEQSLDLAQVPVPPADGPRLGATANATPVMERPAQGAMELGYLHAGATVARAAEPLTEEGCEGGWFPIRPRGFVCLAHGATLDLSHPTLAAMSLKPKLDEQLPYTFGFTANKTSLFVRDKQQQDAVRPVEAIPPDAAMAIVGSWSARDPEGKMQRLAMMTDGRFVSADDLRPAEPSRFAGVELGGDTEALPVGFVVKRGIGVWQIQEGRPQKQRELEYHEILSLTGRYRTIDGLRFWAMPNERWVRHRDVTVVRRRNVFPDFAVGDQKWIDISIITGTCVLYEGKRPVYVTLVSVGQDRLGDPETSASTAQGTFHVVGKHITAAKMDPQSWSERRRVYDVPWVLELSSGQVIHAAYWHDRFGVEHGRGNIQLSTSDARRVWLWAAPELPEGWHAVTQPKEDSPTLVVVRK